MKIKKEPSPEQKRLMDGSRFVLRVQGQTLTGKVSINSNEYSDRLSLRFDMDSPVTNLLGYLAVYTIGRGGEYSMRLSNLTTGLLSQSSDSLIIGDIILWYDSESTLFDLT